MQPSPRAETSRLLFPSLRFCMISSFDQVPSAMSFENLIRLPGHSPVFLRVSRLHDELSAREFECARQVLADKRTHQRALDVEGEGVPALIDVIRAKGCLVAALRILHRRSVGRGLRVGLRVS